MCPLLTITPTRIDPADDLLQLAGQIPHPLARPFASCWHPLMTHLTLFPLERHVGTANGAPLRAGITVALYVGSSELTGAPTGGWMLVVTSLISQRSDPP